MEIVAANVVASRPPNTTCANSIVVGLYQSLSLKISLVLFQAHRNMVGGR